jgi:hypothetical protein
VGCLMWIRSGNTARATNMTESIHARRLPGSDTPSGSFWEDLKPKLSPITFFIGVTLILKLVQIYFPASAIAQALHHYLYFF